MTDRTTKRIIYIATREPSYSRVSIIRSALSSHFDIDEILCERKNYPLRLAIIACRFLWAWISGRLKRSDAVFVGFFAQPIFPLIRLFYRGPIIADAYFSLYDTLVFDKQKTKPGSLLAKFCFWLDQQMLKHADLCFTDTESHVEYFKSNFFVPNANVRRLWISADWQPLAETPPVPMADEPLHVFFWGGFIPLQGVETIVRAAALLQEPNVQFTVVGNGQTFDRCQELAHQLGADNILFDGWKSVSEIQKTAAQSHIALGIFGSTEKAARVIPNKVFEGLALGIPLITRESPAIDELLSDAKDVLLVPHSDAQALAEKILWARENFAEALTIAARGQSVFGQFASPEQVAEILRDEIRTLLDVSQAESTTEMEREPAKTYLVRRSAKEART